MLDEIGRDLPSLLHDPGFRKFARELAIPPWPAERAARTSRCRCLRLYYVRLGFLASAYVNQVGRSRRPRCCRGTSPCRCARPAGCSAPADPQLRRLRPVQLEAVRSGRPDRAGQHRHAAELRAPLRRALVHPGARRDRGHRRARSSPPSRRPRRALDPADPAEINARLARHRRRRLAAGGGAAADSGEDGPGLYYKTFRPYIRFFENVVYEGVDEAPINFRGETGAQSSIMPTLVAFMKIDHNALRS